MKKYEDIIAKIKERYLKKDSNIIIQVEENGEYTIVDHIPNFYINFLGIGNIVVFHKNTRFTKCTADFKNNNFIYIGKTRYDIYKLNIKAPQCQFGTIFIDDNFSCWSTTLRPSFKSGIYIGKDCQFSYEITIWTSDGHAILDEKGKCLNPDKDTVIGDHVWLGHAVEVLKGSEIPSGCVVGARSLVTKSFEEPNSVFAGSPARLVKSNIRWERMSPHHFY